jgi:hypothetical protein
VSSLCRATGTTEGIGLIDSGLALNAHHSTDHLVPFRRHNAKNRPPTSPRKEGWALCPFKRHENARGKDEVRSLESKSRRVRIGCFRCTQASRQQVETFWSLKVSTHQSGHRTQTGVAGPSTHPRSPVGRGIPQQKLRFVVPRDTRDKQHPLRQFLAR